MFQCFATKNIWPGIFTFSLTLFQFVAKCFETFQISDLVIFWVCFNLFQLIYYIIYMFQCFATKNIWPGTFTFSLTLFQFVAKCFETFQISDLVIFWVCFNLFQLIYYIIYMFQCFATKNIWPGIFTFSLSLFQFVAKRFKTFQSSDLVIFLGLFQFVSVINYIIYMFQCFATRNIWPGIFTFSLTLIVSICCETFRNVSKFGLSHFWVCFNLFQLIYYIIYMFQCFATKNIWPGIFTFSLTLFQFVAKCFETFQILDLVIFWLCFNLFQLIYYIIYMFQCFATKNIWPRIFTFSLTLFQFVAKCFETFQISDLVIFWVCFNLFQLIYYIIYMFQCFATKNIWPGIFTFSLSLFQLVAKRFETFQSSDFWVCFNLFQLIYYIIYMFQCFATKNIWPGIFTFSLSLFQFVAKRFKFGLSHFWLCFNLFQLIHYIISMFQSVSKHVQVRT